MSLVPGDTRSDGFGEQFVLDSVHGTKLLIQSLATGAKRMTALSEWEKWEWVRTAKQTGLFEVEE